MSGGLRALLLTLHLGYMLIAFTLLPDSDVDMDIDSDVDVPLVPVQHISRDDDDSDANNVLQD